MRKSVSRYCPIKLVMLIAVFFSRCFSTLTSISASSTFRSKLIQGKSPLNILWCPPSVTWIPTSPPPLHSAHLLFLENLTPIASVCLVPHCLPFASCKLTQAASFCVVPTYCVLITFLVLCFHICGPCLSSPENSPRWFLLWGAHLLSAQHACFLL